MHFGNPILVISKSDSHTDPLRDTCAVGSPTAEMLEKYGRRYLPDALPDTNSFKALRTVLRLVHEGSDAQIVYDDERSTWKVGVMDPALASHIRSHYSPGPTEEKTVLLSIVSTRDLFSETVLTAAIRAAKTRGMRSVSIQLGKPDLTAPSVLGMAVNENHTCIPIALADQPDRSSEEEDLQWSGELDSTYKYTVAEELTNALSTAWPLKRVKSDIEELKLAFTDAMQSILGGSSALIGIEVDGETQGISVSTLLIDMAGKGEQPYLIVQEGLPVIFDSPDLMSSSTFENLSSYHE